MDIKSRHPSVKLVQASCLFFFFFLSFTSSSASFTLAVELFTLLLLFRNVSRDDVYMGYNVYGDEMSPEILRFIGWIVCVPLFLVL